MLAGFAAIVAGIAALLMALPRPARRVGVSLLVLFHFVGIFSQVSWHSYEGLPWFNEAADVYVYRPYLEFVYLTAGYHYYGGDPGPSDLFWFCIKYDNGDTRWFKLPRRPKDMSDPLGLECQRRYVLADQAAGIASVKEIPKETMSSRDAMSANIPWHPYISHENQYQPPSSGVRKFLLPSYVRHVAVMPSSQHSDVRTSIKSIKVYRVAQSILPPDDVANVGFNDPPTYMPYFLGEFDSEGKLINENDPMWGWLVPIFHRPKSANVPGCHTARTFPAEFELVDGLRIHAGSNYDD